MKSSVFQLWQTIEALTPPEAARISSTDSVAPVYGLAIDSAMPWNDLSHKRKRIDPGWCWQYVAQCGIYSVDSVSRRLVQTMQGAEQPWTERTGTRSRLFDLELDSEGYPLAHTFSLSLAAWASGLLIRERGDVNKLADGATTQLDGLPVPDDQLPEIRSGFHGFDMLSMALMQLVEDQAQLMRSDARPADVAWLRDLAMEVAERTGIAAEDLDQRAPLRVRCIRTKLAREEGGAASTREPQDILTSFYVEDLKRVEASYSAGTAGKALGQFMSAGTGKFRVDRLDVRDEDNVQGIFDSLRPEKMPPGRWPSDHALVYSQQLAVNEAVGALASDAGLFAINGPPGTGKTTLLRDVVASVVTQRAAQLVKLRGRHFAEKQVLKLSGLTVPHYPLHESLQGFSIVVASSNNGAVENVSLELPGAAAVPQRVPHSYFPDIASKVIGKPAWGLLAAALGNKANRGEFLRRFWWGEGGSGGTASEPRAALRETLRALQQGARSPSVTWEVAAARFKAAMECEEQWRSHVQALAKLPELVAHLTLRLNSDQAALTRLNDQLLQHQLACHALHEKSSAADKALWAAVDAADQASRGQRLHALAKPGTLARIATKGAVYREWCAVGEALQARSRAACKRAGDQRAAVDAITAGMADLNAHIDALTKKRDLLARTIEATASNLEDHETKLQRAMSQLRGNWPMLDADPAQREHSSPWAHPGWLQAREDVFIAALDVHRAFIEAHPTQMIANLGLASDWLSGKSLPPDAAKLAMESLCLVVPVISTTFASVPRMFPSIGSQAIGWLLIDEAGQAIPSHAACAIWRARRTVIVGDPRQLEPVSAMPQAVETMLADSLGVSDGWLPSRVSAQGLADRSSRLGTWLPEDRGERVWIGCPLRLHRRCDEPMFSISNAVAYGGMMVHGKAPSTACKLPPSAWLDVRGSIAAGHWIVEEETCLRRLVANLLSAGVPPAEMAMVSPFRDCAQNLRRIGREFGVGDGKVGTVHTAQGKEAEVVVLVLGGDPRMPGAKAWAASKPNLLNVANSRAKARLYVIGNRELWAKQNYFSVLAERLPTYSTVMQDDSAE